MVKVEKVFLSMVAALQLVDANLSSHKNR